MLILHSFFTSAPWVPERMIKSKGRYLLIRFQLRSGRVGDIPYFRVEPAVGGYFNCFINASCLSDNIFDNLQRHALNRQLFRVNDALFFGVAAVFGIREC